MVSSKHPFLPTTAYIDHENHNLPNIPHLLYVLNLKSIAFKTFCCFFYKINQRKCNKQLHNKKERRSGNLLKITKVNCIFKKCL